MDKTLLFESVSSAISEVSMELNIEQALQQGILAHKEGKLQDAEIFYRSILQTQPKHSLANHCMGVLAVSVDETQKALPLFKTAVEVNPEIEQFWLSYVDALIRDGDFEKARGVIEQGRRKGLAEDRVSALVARMKSVENSSAPKQSELISLGECFKERQFSKAETLAVSLTQRFPKHPFGWKVLGAVLNQTGQVSESLAPSQKAVELAPDDVNAHNNLGVIFETLNRLEESEAALRQAITLKFDYAEAHANLGNTLKEMGRLEEAEAALRQAIAFKPDYADANYNLGNTLKEMGRLEEAEAALRQAIAFKVDFAEAHNNLGNILRETGRLAESETNLRKALALKPEYLKAHNNLGVLLREMGRLEEAEASLRQAVTLNPNYDEAHSNLGVTLQEMDRLEEAEASYKEAIAINPSYLSAKHMLAALSGETTKTAPRDYVEGVFDAYAARFDSSLVDTLEYKIPKVITDIITRDNGFNPSSLITDLGCGTGLFGAEIKQFCSYLEGVDLSEKMLDEAKKKKVYDKLIKRDIVDYLSNNSVNFDYFVATDVFIYVGDLFDVFRLIKSQSRASGKLAFSTEDYDGEGFFLEKSGRYSHSKRYIDDLCERFDYKLHHFETLPLRKAKNQFIKGGVYLLEF